MAHSRCSYCAVEMHNEATVAFNVNGQCLKPYLAGKEWCTWNIPPMVDGVKSLAVNFKTSAFWKATQISLNNYCCDYFFLLCYAGLEKSNKKLFHNHFNQTFLIQPWKKGSIGIFHFFLSHWGQYEKLSLGYYSRYLIKNLCKIIGDHIYISSNLDLYEPTLHLFETYLGSILYLSYLLC